MNHPVEDIGALLHGEIGRDAAVITAGAGNDGVEINGPSIDLTALANQGKRRFRSAKVFIQYKAVLAAAATLTLAANLQTANETGFTTGVADLDGVLASAVVATGPGGGGTVTGVAEFKVDLTQAKQWIRLQSTADLSAANTDTVAIAAVIVMGDPDEAPVV